MTDGEHIIGPAGLDVPRQPTETSCGPTCLYGVYRHYGDDIEHAQVIEETSELPTGGTLAVHLGAHALARGYRAKLYSLNLEVLDPSWFTTGADIADKLHKQATLRSDDKQRLASRAYAEFLELGGEIELADVTHDLIRRYLDQGIPLLAGVSATYLYRSPRERHDGTYDDLEGHPQGHFVVVGGYRGHDVLVQDPWHGPGRKGESRYWMPLRRFVQALVLGVLTYDGNLLVITRP
ncbi:MAG: C39 family peptidase [Polyangiaceae bacterium]